MHRQAMKSLLMSGALIAALALAGGAAPAGAESLADALVKAYQTSPLLESNRAALRSQNEAVPQAKANLRPQVDLNLQANTQSTIEDIADQLNQTQAALNVTLTLFDNGQTKAAVESARNTVAASSSSGGPTTAIPTARPASGSACRSTPAAATTASCGRHRTFSTSGATSCRTPGGR